MLVTRRSVALFALALALLTTGWLAACNATKAAPLEVTYYYLPG